ncbi:MAG: DUF454 domain-containing protein [Flavobacterium sp.]|nr:DUF454 domain-containing protein [Flavobacterium sp.]
MKLLKKYFLIGAGFLSLGLGLIGIITPVLPTTPFLLLSSYCFLRSSEKLYDWLIHHKIFGKYIFNYLKYHAVTKKVKITAIIFLWISLSISVLIINSLWLQIVLIAVGIVVSVHILLIKTLK